MFGDVAARQIFVIYSRCSSKKTFRTGLKKVIGLLGLASVEKNPGYTPGFEDQRDNVLESNI